MNTKTAAIGLSFVCVVSVASYEDPGWYKHPEGTVASLAARDELSRDGIGS